MYVHTYVPTYKYTYITCTVYQKGVLPEYFFHMPYLRTACFKDVFFYFFFIFPHFAHKISSRSHELEGRNETKNERRHIAGEFFSLPFLPNPKPSFQKTSKILLRGVKK